MSSTLPSGRELLPQQGTLTSLRSQSPRGCAVLIDCGWSSPSRYRSRRNADIIRAGCIRGAAGIA